MAMNQTQTAPKTEHRIPLQDYIGLTVERMGTPSRVVVPLTDHVRGAIAPAHGGVLATMIDVACAASIGQETYGGGFPVSTELSVRFYSQPKQSPLIAEGQVVHRGSRIIGVECVVRDGLGRQVARGSGSYMLLSDFGDLAAPRRPSA
jgi:uncharacterized protein (TIGR00369 family)